jgi:hypothetical protein
MPIRGRLHLGLLPLGPRIVYQQNPRDGLVVKPTVLDQDLEMPGELTIK